MSTRQERRDIEAKINSFAEVHQGIDYTVVLLGYEGTEEASFRVHGRSHAESMALATRVAALWNAGRMPPPE